MQTYKELSSCMTPSRPFMGPQGKAQLPCSLQIGSAIIKDKEGFKSQTRKRGAELELVIHLTQMST